MGVTATSLSNLSVSPLANHLGEMMVAVTLSFLLAYLDLLRVTEAGRHVVPDVERGVTGAVVPLGLAFGLVIASHLAGVV